MKKEVLSVIIIFLFLCFHPVISAEITDEIITGKITSQEMGLSIFIQTAGGIPSIFITSPKNQTYLKNESILLNYTVLNGDFVWYNVDNSENTTINSPIYINISQGPHILYIYSNNTNGTGSEEISFTANSSRFVILFEEYKGLNKGNSTNFIDYTYEEIQNLNYISLENTNYGKIMFNTAINLTNDRNNTDNLLDLDLNTEISSNKIEVNCTELPNLNKPATIWLYNLGFNNPRILKDGEVCPSTICVEESYSEGTLKFNVTHFTSYSAEETPSGGGGDEGDDDGDSEREYIFEEIISPTGEIKMDPPTIQTSLKQGEGYSQNFYLINTYNEKIKIKLEVYGINQFVGINETEFELLPGETKVVSINFSIGEDSIPDSYVGKIFTKTYLGIYETNVLINVQSKGSILDLSLEINKENLTTYPGKDLFFKVRIYNIGESKEMDLTIKYTLKDSNGNIILEEESTEKIKDYLEKEGKIKIPRHLPTKKYILSVKVEYEDGTAIASSDFMIQKKKLNIYLKVLIILAVMFIILILLWIMGKREEKKEKEELETKNFQNK